MFNLSGTELLFIAILGLVVLGPEKLPAAMRRAGKVYREIRNITSNVQREVNKVMEEPIRDVRRMVEEPAAAAASAFTAVTNPLKPENPATPPIEPGVEPSVESASDVPPPSPGA